MLGTNTGYKTSVWCLSMCKTWCLMFTAPTPLGHILCSKMAQASATTSLRLFCAETATDASLKCHTNVGHHTKLAVLGSTGNGGRVGGREKGAVEYCSYLFMYLQIWCNLLTSKLHQTHRRLLIPSEMLLATDVAWGLTWKRLLHPTSNIYPGNCNSGRWATATCLSRWNRQNRSWS